MSDTSLVFNLLAKDKVSSTLGKVGKKVDRMSALIVGGVAAAAVGLGKLGGEFDAAYDTIITGTGATGAALDGLKGDFKEVVKDVPTDFASASQAIADLNTMTGAAGEPLQAMTSSVLEASRVLDEDGAANAKAFGQAMQQWQVPASEGPAQLDKLFSATQQFGVGLGEITGHLNTYGSVLQNAGFSMDESAALFGQLEKSGLAVSRVMPGLNAAFRNWSAEGLNTQDMLTTTVDKIKNASSSTEALNIATEAFGAEGAQRMTTAVRSGALSLEDLSSVLADADGSIAETAEETKSWQEKLTLLKNKGFVLLEPIAMRVFDLMGTGADKLAELAEWAQRNQGIVRALGIGLGVLAGAIVSASAAIKIYNTAQMVARGATLAWSAAQWLLNSALFANPIGLVVLAIAALAAAVVVAWKKSETFRTIVTAAFEFVWGVIQKVWSWIKDNWKKLLGILTGPIGMAVGLIAKNWDKIKAGASAAKNWVVDKWTGLVDWFKKLPGAVGKAVAGVGDMISAPFRDAFAGIKSWWNSTVGGFGFETPSWVPLAGGKSFKIPFMAKGGTITSAGMAVVGDAGPEVLSLPRGASVHPLDRAAGAAAGLAGQIVRVVLELRSGGSRFDDLLVEVLRRAIAERGGDPQVVLAR